MPAAAIGAFVDLQAALAPTLTPGKVFLGLCQRGVTVLRFARLVALRGIVLGRRRGATRALARERIVKRIEITERIEIAQRSVELRLLLRP